MPVLMEMVEMMSPAFFRRLQLFVFLVSLMGLGRCPLLLEATPVFQGISTPVGLDGPYDEDIPPRHIHQIRSVCSIRDWAIPYIFLSIGTHF